MIAFAAGESSNVVAAQGVVSRIEKVIIFPLMSLMITVALLVFLWGLYEYVLHAEHEDERSKGKQHMLFGIIGLVVMVSAYTILKIAGATFGVEGI